MRAWFPEINQLVAFSPAKATRRRPDEDRIVNRCGPPHRKNDATDWTDTRKTKSMRGRVPSVRDGRAKIADRVWGGGGLFLYDFSGPYLGNPKHGTANSSSCHRSEGSWMWSQAPMATWAGKQGSRGRKTAVIWNSRTRVCLSFPTMCMMAMIRECGIVAIHPPDQPEMSPADARFLGVMAHRGRGDLPPPLTIILRALNVRRHRIHSDPPAALNCPRMGLSLCGLVPTNSD